MTKRLFSTAKKRTPYRPKGYRTRFALDNESTTPEDIGPVADEFEGDLSNDPLEDVDDSFWAAAPGVSDEYDDVEREETITNKTSSIRRAYKGFPYNDLHNQPFIPGHKWPTYLYRGLAIKMPSDVEGELDFAIMEGDQQGVFQVGRKILDIIGRSGIGRHWTTEPDVAMDFANMNKSSGNLVVVISALWEHQGQDSATEHEGHDGVMRPSNVHGEFEVTLKPGTRIKLLSLRGSRVLNGRLLEHDFDIEFLPSPEMRTASQLVANDGVLDSLNPTGTIFTEYTPEDRAGLGLAPNIRPYSETAGLDPDDRVVVYRGVPKGLQSELADGDFITDMEQLAKDYAGTGDVISQEVFADEILDDLEDPMAGEYLFRPRRASKKTAEDYFMEHRPAGPDSGSPLHDLNDTFPDIYDSPHYYDFGEPGNKDSFTSIQRAKGNPEEMVTMYRSIPSDGTPSFAPGDWVSTSGDYARQHSLSENEEDDDFIVMEQQVPASSLWSEGNSVAEWGFHGEAMDGIISEKYTPKKTLERLRSQKSSSRREANERVYYHNTANPGFSPDPSYEPNKSYWGAPEGPGIYLTDNTSDWRVINNGMGSVFPTHRAEFSTSTPLEEFPGVKHSPGGISQSQFWVPGEVMSELNYRGVFPIDEETKESSRREANSEFPALPEDFVRNISPDGFDSRWNYETTGYEPRSSDDRYELSINPVNSPSVIPGEENGLRKKPIFYDPERTELEWDDLFGHSPTRQDRDLSHLSPPEGLLWRGMSNEEYENAKLDGYFQSKGDWNFEGQEGETYFSTDPDAAANYANDFAPIQFKPGFGNPAHVIGIPDRPDLPRYEHEVGVPGQIPFSDVVQHYTGHPTAISPGSNSYFNDTFTGEWSEGGGMGPAVSLAWEPGEGYKPKTSRRVAGTEDRPGNLYRGIASDFLTDDEYDQIVDWAKQNEFDPDNFQMAEPNYEMIYPILERLEEEGGLGRHWSIDYDVADDFATQNAWRYDEAHGRDEDDPDYRTPFGIVFRGDWDGEGVDYAERHRGYDGVMRPSNLEHEKEVTLHPGSEVNLLGMDVFEPGGFRYDIPVPDIKVRAHKSNRERRKTSMNAINNYLRYAKRQGLDPKESHTSRAYRRASRSLSPKSMVEISNWMKAQKTAHQTARQVLATTRGYRRKLSSSWHLDSKLGAYISTVQQKFACSCGAKLDVPAYNMCKCGKVWNAYKVHSATKGDTMYVVREVPVRENVLVANKTASRRRQAQDWEGARGNGWDTPAADLGAIPDEELLEFVVNVQNAIDAGANIGTIMDNKKGHFVSELISRGWRVDKTGIPYREARRRRSRRHTASDLGAGDEVFFITPEGDIDDSVVGKIVQFPAVDPSGNTSNGAAEVEWSDGSFDIVEVDSLANAQDRLASRRRRSRRVANDYDAWDDTYDFLDHAKGRGYRFPKNMGDPDSGTFQDELWDYTKGDRSRMERITDTARGNWGELRHASRTHHTRRGRR